ncbi:hypothetical protein JCGZ_23647 [Jatropha curcas]|uniref:Calcineurin-like phosphoesterase domain-containing protein n=1 Tax=Jatropha curcas TaxID=180498 RepID=A0A067L2U7_JATCU|nr:hypothetical protein JCGZ_23647 [Jatropha curcas]
MVCPNSTTTTTTTSDTAKPRVVICIGDIHEYLEDVCIQKEEGIKHCKLIAVHAGLEKWKNVEEQLKSLKAKDTRVPRIIPLSGKEKCLGYPKGDAHLLPVKLSSLDICILNISVI